MRGPRLNGKTISLRWGFVAIWVTLPFMAGPALAEALDPRLARFRSVASVGLWLGWVVVLAAALVPRTVSLTIVRIMAPAGFAAAVWAALATPSAGLDDGLALGATALAAVLAFAPVFGDELVNGSSYGDERRFPLRAPAALLLGPIELTWAVVVAGAVSGPLLLASHQWAAGIIALALGWPVAWWGSRSLHALSRRWLVFTPAGIVLHDQLGVVEAMLVVRNQVQAIRPALADSTARDLTQGAPGLALEIVVVEPLPITPTPPRRLGSRAVVVSEDITAVLFTPSRPGVVLAEARVRRFPVG